MQRMSQQHSTYLRVLTLQGWLGPGTSTRNDLIYTACDVSDRVYSNCSSSIWGVGCKDCLTLRSLALKLSLTPGKTPGSRRMAFWPFLTLNTAPTAIWLACFWLGAYSNISSQENRNNVGEKSKRKKTYQSSYHYNLSVFIHLKHYGFPARLLGESRNLALSFVATTEAWAML